jgi:hypothetical protein
MWVAGDEIFWVKIILYIILCVFSEQLYGRPRKKSEQQEGFVNGKYFNAFDMVLRDIILEEEEEEAVNTRETEQQKRLRSRKFCQKDNLVRVYDY